MSVFQNVSTDEVYEFIFLANDLVAWDKKSREILDLFIYLVYGRNKINLFYLPRVKKHRVQIVSVPRFLSRDATRYSIKQKLEPDSHWPDLFTRTNEIIIW